VLIPSESMLLDGTSEAHREREREIRRSVWAEREEQEEEKEKTATDVNAPDLKVLVLPLMIDWQVEKKTSTRISFLLFLQP
jgi:hypothetical protein